MMSFLKSILFRSGDKIKHLEQKLDEANERILALEETTERISQAISSLGMCVTAIAAATQDLSLDMSMMSTVVRTASKRDSDSLFDWRVKSDDDDFIN